jgi:2-dehydro-3-deoxy-D-gluconate 5-dehydrogenase
MLTEFDLSGRVALVTGGNRGIGRGIALGLARAGADVAIAARSQETTARTVAEVVGLVRRAAGLSCYVTVPGGRPQELGLDVWDRVLDTNLRAVFVSAQAAYPAMQAAGYGKVITVGSEYSIFGSEVVAPYSASKGGVVQLTKSLAVAWARDNIQVNCIIPGWITTDMTAPLTNTPRYEAIVRRTPARRFGEPDELAGAAVFLASRASDFVTGQSLVVDGGYSIA